MKLCNRITFILAGVAALLGAASAPATKAQEKPNIVMLMTDDTGWNDFGAYSGGGKALGHPTPNIDRMAKEGAVFTSWYGQASCTAGRANFNYRGAAHTHRSHHRGAGRGHSRDAG